MKWRKQLLVLKICIVLLVAMGGIASGSPEDDGSGLISEQTQISSNQEGIAQLLQSEDNGSGLTSEQTQISSSQKGTAQLLQSVSPMSNAYTAYASWDDDNNLNEGFVYIYPLQNGTDITLYYTNSTTTPIQINKVANTWINANAGVPLQFGPLTDQQYFFKLVSNKPVNWELITENYAYWREASRFVISEQMNYRGTIFYFHADKETYEKIFVINPGISNSGTVTLYKWNATTSTWNTITSTININPDAFWNVSVPSRGFYKIESENPVLVYEGRLYNQNMATGVTAEGDTVGNIVYSGVPYDSFVGSFGGVTLHVMGVTNANYTVYRNIGTGWTFVTSSSVVAGSSNTHANLLPMNAVYKIVTNSSDQKILVQYLTAWTSPTARGGAEMIPAIDGGDTTNPGTQFYLYFDGGTPGSYSYQKYIDVLIPESGTNVNISGPVSTNFTSTVNDEAYHWTPGNGNGGMYKVTSTKPVYVVVMSNLGDEQGYFVYSPLVVLSVTIDIKPGSYPNAINPANKGVIPVAILTTETFDASLVDPTTVKFGRTGTEASQVHWALEDVDGDGDLDMILQFKTQETGIQPGDTEAKLTGKTVDNVSITGSDSIKTVP